MRAILKFIGATAGVVVATLSVLTPVSATEGAAGTGTSLEEVVVTAQKIEQRLIDVPAPVAVVNTQSLTDNGQSEFRDYYMQIPGVSYTTGTEQNAKIYVRGLGATSTLDDFPLAGGLVTDLDPADLAQVEVLRGPQGTLYGADNLGGLVRYVLAQPSTSAEKGEVQVGGDDIYNGAGAGYSLRARVNAPITGDTAAAISAFYRHDPGYIDNPIVGIRGVNDVSSGGGHLGFGWMPTEDFSLRVNAIYQRVTGGSVNEVDMVPGLGNWQQNTIAGVGAYQREASIVTAVAEWKTAFADLTSVTGYSWTGFHDSVDLSGIPGLGALLSSGVSGPPPDGFPGYGVAGVGSFDDWHDTTLYQEMRVRVPLGKRVEMLLGGIAEYVYASPTQLLNAVNTDTGAVSGQAIYSLFPGSTTDFSGFTTFTYHVTERLTLQLGGRYQHVKNVSEPQYNYGPASGLFLGNPNAPLPSTTPEMVAKSDATTYLFAPSFKFTPDFIGYARLASGFEPGVGNPPIPGVQRVTPPPKTQEYEAGIKGEFLNEKASVDAAAYHIVWTDIPVGLLSSHDVQYTAGGGRAKSEGVELSLQARPVRSLKLAGWVALDETKITEAQASSSLTSYVGEPLPFAPKLSWNISADQSFALGQGVTGFVGATVSAVGEREDQLASPRRDLPGYTKTDVRAGVEYGAWQLDLYGNNITNRRGLIGGDVSAVVPYANFYIQPRTIGLTVSRDF